MDDQEDEPQPSTSYGQSSSKPSPLAQLSTNVESAPPTKRRNLNLDKENQPQPSTSYQSPSFAQSTSSDNSLVVSPPTKRKTRALTSTEKVMISNLFKHLHQELLQEEIDSSGLPPVMVTIKRATAAKKTAAYLGISQKSVYNVLKNKHLGHEFTDHKRTKTRLTVLDKLDDHELSVIRRKVHDFYHRNEAPTISKVLKAVNDDPDLPNLKWNSLRKVLKHLNFKYVTHSRRSALIDRQDIIQWRRKYLLQIKEYRRQGRPIYYQDETWLNAAPRTSCTGGTPNNLPPLTFSHVHGDNVRISQDGSIARRVESFCKGIAFSARPVRVHEKVFVRFVEISNNWSGVLRFGFTTHDPVTIAHNLPKYACPDLTNKPGNWAKALGERFCEKDNILYYYVNSAGDVHFGVNGEDKGVFFTGVDTRKPLWSLVDIYGNCTAVQFADPRAPYQIRQSLPSLAETEDRLAGSMRSLSIEENLPPTRFQNQAVQPLTLHRTKGRNVQFVSERGVAARAESEFCQGYVFTARPMRPGQTLVVQILATEPAYAGSLAIGLTSCDPASLRPCDLPDDAELLLDRPEYWVVRRDAANGLKRGDELSVTLTVDGEVRVSRNGSNPITVMHVDHTLRLWAFVDIYGATQKVRLLSSQTPQPVPTPPPAQQLRVLAGSASPITTAAGGTVLVVSLPPANGGQHVVGNPQALTLASAHYIEPMQSTSNLCMSNFQAQPSGSCASIPYNGPAPVQRRNADCSNQNSQNCQNEQSLPQSSHPEPRTERLINHPINVASSSHHQPLYSVIGEGLTGAECTICYENPIDSVLYMCGHMCMCYRCAVQQWRGKGGGQCPLCRANIKDVIRTYKS